MIPHNPRKFSIRLGIAVGTGVALAAFVSICFEFGNGNFFAGISSAANYLLILWFGAVVIAGIAATIAVLLGRLIGITITATVAFCLLLTLVVTTYVGSHPIHRFRKLVWEDAPKSLHFHQHEAQKSFSDGTTYTFVIAGNPDLIGKLCLASKLSKAAGSELLSIYFQDVTFPPDTQFYRGIGIELGFTSSGGNAFVVCLPSPVR